MTRLLLPLLLLGSPTALAAPPEPTPLVMVEPIAADLVLDDRADAPIRADKPKKAPAKRFELRLPWWAWVSIIAGGLLITFLICILCGWIPVVGPNQE